MVSKAVFRREASRDCCVGEGDEAFGDVAVGEASDSDASEVGDGEGSESGAMECGRPYQGTSLLQTAGGPVGSRLGDEVAFLLVS